MTITDCIVLGCSVFFIIRGASRGFLRSILGPFSLIIATILSTVIYQTTHNVVLALMIGLFGPMAIQFLIGHFLTIWHQFIQTEWKPSPLSAVAGAVLTLIWGLSFVLITVVLLSLVPPMMNGVKPMHDDIHRSMTYQCLKPLLPWNNKNTAMPAAASMAGNPALSSLAQDARFAALMQDPEIQKAVDSKDYSKLFSNPKIMALTQELMSDPNMIKKLMAAQQELINTKQK